MNPFQHSQYAATMWGVYLKHVVRGKLDLNEQEDAGKLVCLMADALKKEHSAVIGNPPEQLP